MSEEIIPYVTAFFEAIWSIFTNIQLPFFNMNFANLWVGVLASWAIVKFIEKVIGISGDGLSSDYSSKSEFYRDRGMDWRY